MQLDTITRQFLKEHAHESAHIPIYRWQKCWYVALLGAALLLYLWRWDYFLATITFLTSVFYCSIIGFRLVATVLSLLCNGEVSVDDTQIAALTDDELPVYTILVPLYKEANVATKIVHHINALDYPHDRLDVKLLLEADDRQTCDAINALELPPCFDVIVVPDSFPKTKPKACNHGLRRARGDYLVIFDAEDRPEPDQLKKVLCVFAQATSDVVCVQAKLNYFNPRQNLLTRWFTIEYSAWFDLYLPGLVALKMPIPLGGTSNHFAMAAIKELGGWDPFNVTEDCDLGVRLYKRGQRTVVVNSTTWEEANSRVPNWIRQRSRWVKGYFQTHLVHSRHPLNMLRDIGPWGLWGFLMTVGGLAFMLVLNLLYWLVATIYAVSFCRDWLAGHNLWNVLAGPRDDVRFAWKMIYYGPQEHPVWSTLSLAFFAISCALVFANILVITINILACIRRKNADLIPMAILSPVYWVLISLGAWKGFIQLFTAPFYWEKTDHGLDRGSD